MGSAAALAFLYLLHIILRFINPAQCFVDSELMQFITEYFSRKSVSTLVLFTCSDTGFCSHRGALEKEWPPGVLPADKLRTEHQCLSRQDQGQLWLQLRQNLLKFLTFSSRLWLYAPGDEQRTATLQTIVPQDFYSVGVFLDYTCPAGRETLVLNSGREYLNGSHHWLVSSDSPQVPRVVDELRLRLDSELVWATRENGTITLHDLYKIDHNWPVVHTVAGSWHVSTGLKYNLTQWKYHASRRGDLQGLNLLAALMANLLLSPSLPTSVLPPTNFLHFSPARHSPVGFDESYVVTAVTTPTYGYVTEDDKYEGIVRMVGESEVNMTISIMIVSNKKRLEHMHYLACPMKIFRLAAIFRNPPTRGGYYALLETFSPVVWLFVLLTWLLVAVFLRLLAWLQARVSRSRHEDLDETHGWSDVMLLIFGVLAEQGASTWLDSRWIAWRLAFFVMLVLTVLLNTYYGACVMSALLTETSNDIRTVRDLINSPLKFAAEKVQYGILLFEIDNNPVIQELRKKKMVGRRGEKPVYYTREEGVKKVLQENFAFHTDAYTVYSLIEQTFPDEEKCSLTEIKVFPITEQYVVVPHSSPLKEPLTWG
ncbi:hypothetical protein PR048_000571 [Dryococelus australis]|uniref:Ionotropic glutamate receptor C-terminal domain-containing protein n=1 Tax=Dryococelus australis TaxID=614101 RepID=A0ABQ9IF50_9NEOP|nr:hypothetical protein PR048_000571 [Dryococelus australis]